MRAVLTAVIAAIEAAAIVLAGLVLVAIPGVLLYWLALDLEPAPEQVIAGISGFWLLAHFVPLRVEVDAVAAAGLGLPAEQFDIVFSLAPLGLTLVTVLLAARIGIRFADRGGVGSAAILGGALGFGAGARVLVALAEPIIDLPMWSATAIPTLCFVISASVAFVVRAAVTEQEWWESCVRWVLRRVCEPLFGRSAAAFPTHTVLVVRLTVGALFGLLTLTTVGVAAAIVVGYVDIVSLSQGLQLDPLGIVLTFLLTAALLPVMFIWGIAWFSGAGFAIGQATSVTPFETLLGPLPALPLFGAIPQGWGAAGALAPGIIVVLGIVIGSLFAGTSELRTGSLAVALGAPILAAAFAGLAVVALAALATGSIGPGRLEHTGPEAWLAGGLVAAELAVGLVLGVLVRRYELQRFVLRRASNGCDGLPVAHGADGAESPVMAGAEQPGLAGTESSAPTETGTGFFADSVEEQSTGARTRRAESESRGLSPFT